MIVVLEKLAQMERRYQEIEELMASPAVATDSARLTELAKEHSSLESSVSIYRKYVKTLEALEEARVIIYATDGYGPFPEEEPDTPTLWLSWGKDEDAYPFGQVVNIKQLIAQARK